MDIKVGDTFGGVSKIAGGATGKTAGQEDSSFGGFLRDQINDVGETMNKAESLSIQGVMGTADPVDVVTAITEAELVLQTVTSIRDRMVSAIKDVFSMPV